MESSIPQGLPDQLGTNDWSTVSGNVHVFLEHLETSLFRCYMHFFVQKSMLQIVMPRSQPSSSTFETAKLCSKLCSPLLVPNVINKNKKLRHRHGFKRFKALPKNWAAFSLPAGSRVRVGKNFQAWTTIWSTNFAQFRAQFGAQFSGLDHHPRAPRLRPENRAPNRAHLFWSPMFSIKNLGRPSLGFKALPKKLGSILLASWQ